MTSINDRWCPAIRVVMRIPKTWTLGSGLIGTAQRETTVPHE
jgi:hypothetical protein